MMELDSVTIGIIYVAILGAVISGLLYWRLMIGVRSRVRVYLPGGTEKEFNAAEVGQQLSWVQGKERMSAMIPIDVKPTFKYSFGVHSRVFCLPDGSDQVVPLPWQDPDVLRTLGEGDEGAKERYRRRVRAQDSFRQLTAGLSSINKWQAAVLILLGFFAGLYFAPIIMGAIT
jgi:hypothetical protein